MSFRKISICLEQSTAKSLKFVFPHSLKRNAFVEQAISKALKEKRMKEGFSK